MKNGECSVMVVEHPQGVSQGCKVCGEVFREGKFLIGLHIHEDSRNIKYFLGDPSVACCGEQKTVLVCFENAEEAEAEKRRVVDHILEQKSTEGLLLLTFPAPQLN